MFTLAHLSDPHLGPMPDLKLSQLMSKRFFGYRNWKRNRHKVHSLDLLDALIKDVKCQNIDHVAITGDLVNISLEMEFMRAQKWLKGFGKPEWISVIPGNHDAYVDISWEQSIGLWQDYMSSNKAGKTYTNDNSVFPYIRLHNKIALIGLNSGAVFPPLLARGALGQDQIERASNVLDRLGKEGFFRVVMIHHPPLPGQNIWRKALKENEQFKDILCEYGAELILHGHNHLDMHQTLKTKSGYAHIFGVPSASASGYGHKPASGYNIYTISQVKSAWKLRVEKRTIDLKTRKFIIKEEKDL